MVYDRRSPGERPVHPISAPAWAVQPQPYYQSLVPVKLIVFEAVANICNPARAVTVAARCLAWAVLGTESSLVPSWWRHSWVSLGKIAVADFYKIWSGSYCGSYR